MCKETIVQIRLSNLTHIFLRISNVDFFHSGSKMNRYLLFYKYYQLFKVQLQDILYYQIYIQVSIR